MLALDLLGVPFARAVHLRVQMPRVRTPMIRIKVGETKGFQQRFESQKNLVLTTPKDGIVKLLGMILSPGNRRHFPDAISIDPTLRQPAPYL